MAQEIYNSQTGTGIRDGKVFSTSNPAGLAPAPVPPPVVPPAPTGVPGATVPSILTTENATTKTNQNLNKLNGFINGGAPSPNTAYTANQPPAGYKWSFDANGNRSAVPDSSSGSSSTGKYIFEVPGGKSYTGFYDENGGFVADKPPADTDPDTEAIRNLKGNVRELSSSEVQANQMMQGADDTLNSYLDILNQQQVNVDATLQNTLANIKASYEKRREEQRKLNTAVFGGTSLIEARSGRARYAQQISQDILTQKEQDGINQLTTLDSLEQQSIEAAKSAADEKKFALLNAAITKTDEIRKERNNLLLDLQQEAREQERLTMEKSRFLLEQRQAEDEANKAIIQSSREGAILDLIGQGVTDPIEILNYINYDENGQQVGDLTIKEVSDVMEAVKKAKANPGKFELKGGPKEGLYEVELNENGQAINVRQLIAPEGSADLTKPLSASELKTFREMGYPVTPGMTLGDAQQMGAPVDIGKTPEQIKIETDLRKEFTGLEEVKQFTGMTRSYKSMNSAYNEALAQGNDQDSKAAADQALVTLYNKMLDPTSVVREGEYARSFDGQSAIARVQGYLERLRAGGAGLTDANRKDMVDVAKKLYGDAQETYERTAEEYRGFATEYGVNPDGVVRGMEDLSVSAPTTPIRQMSYPSIESFIKVNPEWTDTALQIAEDNPDLTDQEVIDFLRGGGSFSQGSGGTPIATNQNATTQKLKQSIISQESGGNYKAVGLDTPHGKALGKYQIIPKFHFAKIGLDPNKESDKQKFLNSPALQDKLFALIFDGLHNQYSGDPKKIAAAYYGGGAAAKVVGTSAGDKTQMAGGKNMPSINQYVNSVISRLG